MTRLVEIVRSVHRGCYKTILRNVSLETDKFYSNDNRRKVDKFSHHNVCVGRSAVVYLMNCKDYEKQYVGETGGGG